MKTIMILKSLIDKEIINTFEDEFDITEQKTEYEFDFDFVCCGQKCNAFIMFEVDENGVFAIDNTLDIEVTDSDGLKYSVGNDEIRQNENRLIISDKTYNPNQKTIQQEITAIIDKEKQKQIERDQESKDWEETKEMLNEKMR